MPYERIHPLAPELLQASDGELRALETVWRDRRAMLERLGAIPTLQRLVREAAVETGLVEDLYDFSRGITEVLIEEGLDDAVGSDDDQRWPSDADA